MSDSTFNIEGWSITSTFDSNYLAVGHREGSGLLMKIDQYGDMMWSKKFGVSGNDAFYQIINTSDSNHIIIGKVLRPGFPDLDALCMKINDNGDTLWCRAFDMGHSESALSIIPTMDGGYFITGICSQTVVPYSRTMLLKLDASGYLQWSMSINLGTHSNVGYCAQQTADSGYVIGGYRVNYPSFDMRSYLLKIDKNANIIWTKTYLNQGGSSSKGMFSLDIVPNGIFVLMGSDNGATYGKVDLAGNEIWVKELFACYGFYGQDRPQLKWQRTSDGGYAFCWGEMSMGDIMVIDSLGSGFESFVELRATSFLRTSDNGYLILGNGPLWGVKYSYFHMGLIKTDSLVNPTTCNWGPQAFVPSPVLMTVNAETATGTFGALSFAFSPAISNVNVSSANGCVDFYGSVDESDDIDRDFLLSPNPSTGVFHIIRSPEPEKILGLEVINALGARVNYFEGASALRNVVDLSDQPAGLYHFRLICTDKVYDQQIVIVK